jgi:hypothetical protein
MKKKIIPSILAVLLVLVTLCGLVTVASADDSYIDLTTVTPTKATVGWGSLSVNKGLDGQKIDI